ncbi:11883_t:CDS:1, partial [Acaulospora morrowiae]
MSPITRSVTSPQRICNPNFPTPQDLDSAYRISAPRIQEDAKKYLEILLDFEKVRELYNPFSEEYWFVNNIDALNQVVYYKMKRCLFLRYKQQFVKAGIELEFIRSQGSGIGCGKIGCEDVNCSGTKLEDSYLGDDGDDMDMFCPNSTMFNASRQSSEVSSFRYQDSELSERSVTTDITNNLVKRSAKPSIPPTTLTSMAVFDRGIGFSHFDPSYFLDENPCIKKDDSAQTITGDYEESLQPIQLLHPQHHNNRARFIQNILRYIKCQFSINWFHNLPKERIYYSMLFLFMFVAVFFFFHSLGFKSEHYSTGSIESINDEFSSQFDNGDGMQKQRQKIYKILDNDKLD